MLKKLFEFEEDNISIINNARFNNIVFWDSIRVQFYMNGLDKKNPTKRILGFSKYLFFISILKSFKYLFLKFDYILITSDSEKKIIDGKIYDKSVSKICESLKSDKILIIDFSTRIYDNVQGFKYVINGYTINLFAKIYRCFIRVQFNSESEILFNKLKQVDNYNYKNYLINLSSNISIYNFLLKRWSPKILFNSCYSYYAPAFSANFLNINTYEIQHGIITNAHPAYSSNYYRSLNFRCNKLLAFGNSIFSFLTNDKIFKKECISIIGNGYIEYLSENKFVNKISNYNKVIIVPTDWALEDDLVDFIIQMFELSSSFKIIFTPRDEFKTESLKKLFKYKNRFELHSNEFQDKLCLSDLCITIDSTCALEACAFGVPSILFNLNNRARNFYGNTFNDSGIVKYVESPKESIDILNSWPFYDRIRISNSSDYYFKKGFTTNLQSVLYG